MSYEKAIADVLGDVRVEPPLNVIEALLRVSHPTLDHLSGAQFADAVWDAVEVWAMLDLETRRFYLQTTP